MHRIGLAILLLLELAVVCRLAHGDGTKTGPPAAYTGDSWPTPSQIITIDRCGRGTVGTCGSLSPPCVHNGPGTVTQPLCNLSDLWIGTTPVAPGTLIRVRPGDPTATDKGVYGEQDSHIGGAGTGKDRATFSPTVKGTSVCSGGVNNNWDCRNGFESTDCPGGTCVFKPIVIQGVTEGGTQTTIDPTFVGGVVATGGVTCDDPGNRFGRYIGFDFGYPACANVTNDRTICYGGSTWGKPCATTGDCTGAIACAARPWNWIVDHMLFQNWSDIDPNPSGSSVSPPGHYCSMYAVHFGSYVEGCANNDINQYITIQNSTFKNNFGAGVLNNNKGGGMRWFHNYLIGNRTHGYTSTLNAYVPLDTHLGVTSYYWGNYVQGAADSCPLWGNPHFCTGTATTLQTCIDGPVAGSTCTSEAACQGGHCGPECTLIGNTSSPFGATNPGNQGYNCFCNTTSDCLPGLTCQGNASYNGDCAPSNTEGKAYTIDTAQTNNTADVRNNIFVGSAGDGTCINTSSNFIFANNTLYHNAKKGGGAAPFMEETMTPVLNADIWNNLVVPNPASCSCYGGTAGGTSCTTPGSTACPGGGVCYCPGLAMFDNGFASTNPGSNHNGNELYWFNLAGQTTNPNIFLYASNLLPGTLTAFQAYGTSNGWIRGQNTIAADPQFLSTTVGDPAVTGGFLHIATASPAGHAGNNAFAPPWDFNGVLRPNPPGIGALEPDTGGVTTSSTTSTSTSSTTTTTGPCGTTQTLWPASATPPASNDNQPVTNGTRWFASVTGYVVGIRYYQQPGNTGTHVGHLWQETGQTTGTLLGTVTFTGETGSGWQEQDFPTPIAVSATPTIYLVDVYSPNGDYSGLTNVFTTQLDSGQLHAPASSAGTVTGNGRYIYSNVVGTYPTNTYNAGSYYVDLKWAQCFGSTTTTTTTTTSTTTTTTLPGAGYAPLNWGNDASVVAWWPFDVDVNNHSTSTTYCNPVTDANLNLFNHPGEGIYGTIRIDSTNHQVGAASFQYDGDTCLAQLGGNVNPTGADCLRTAQPNQWTYTFWLRVTAQNTTACTPYPVPLFNRDESDTGVCPLCGSYIEYVSTGASNNGQTFGCTHNAADGTPSTNDACAYPPVNPVTGLNDWFTNNSTWRFAMLQYDGTNLRYGINGTNAPGANTHVLGKNPASYPFQMSHDSNINCHAGVIGNQDDVFWTAAVMTAPQVCRVMACGADGTKCWCASGSTTAYKTCATDADCGGRTGACNTAFGACVGNLLSSPAGGQMMGCAAVADLAGCGSVLTGATTTTTTLATTTSTTTTTTTTSTTTTTLANHYRREGGRTLGYHHR